MYIHSSMWVCLPVLRLTSTVPWTLCWLPEASPKTRPESQIRLATQSGPRQFLTPRTPSSLFSFPPHLTTVKGGCLLYWPQLSLCKTARLCTPLGAFEEAPLAQRALARQKERRPSEEATGLSLPRRAPVGGAPADRRLVPINGCWARLAGAKANRS